jgi:hypothetical protein
MVSIATTTLQRQSTSKDDFGYTHCKWTIGQMGITDPIQVWIAGDTEEKWTVLGDLTPKDVGATTGKGKHKGAKFVKFHGVCLPRENAVVDENTPKGIKNVLREFGEFDHLKVKSKKQLLTSFYMHFK